MKKNIFVIILSMLVVIGITVGVSYAFFNYTKTGGANVIKVGRVDFISNQTKTINLSNAYPIDPTEPGIMNDDTQVGTYELTIVGDTDYKRGIEYLISVTDANITTSNGITVPVSMDISVTNLGTENANYFTAREEKNASIYKKLIGDAIIGDQMLLVGFIKKNTTAGTVEGINGKITIKAYFDANKIEVGNHKDNELISNKTVLTLAEWNSLQTKGVSFKIKVEANEGIWVKQSLDDIIRVKNLNTTTNQPIMDNVASEFVSASTGINFGAVSSDTNGKGVYMRAGTENDAYPIVYYRGAVTDNNVLFADKCWKAVRTTDTGGVKLIYNGESTVNNTYNDVDLDNNKYNILTNTANLEFNNSDKTWTVSITESPYSFEFSFNIVDNDEYIFYATKNNSPGSGGISLYKNGTQLLSSGFSSNTEANISQNCGSLTSSDSIRFTFNGGGFSENNPGIIKIKMVKRNASSQVACNTTYNDAVISVNNNTAFKFNLNSDSPAYNGYMYGDVYTHNYSGLAPAGTYYGSSFTYSNGEYTLTNTSTTKDGTHHYSCNSTNAEGKCSTIRYYYYDNYYINLTGGDGVEEALVKMNTNTTNSNAKTQIDSWYASNMTSVTNKLEDTIWCNDRSIGKANGWSTTGSWGNNYSDYALLYGAYERSNNASNTSIVKNRPSLACANINDAFTVSNGNGNRKLIYPVALLTEDEMVLAGGLVGISSTFYLNNLTSYWSMSPSTVSEFGSYVFCVSGDPINEYESSLTKSLRPSVSLKQGLPVKQGTGTANDPYVIDD